MIEQLLALAREQGAEEMVLGHPLNMDGRLPSCSRSARERVGIRSNSQENQRMERPLGMW